MVDVKGDGLRQTLGGNLDSNFSFSFLSSDLFLNLTLLDFLTLHSDLYSL